MVAIVLFLNVHIQMVLEGLKFSHQKQTHLELSLKIANCSRAPIT
jgi:hypothetical protein